MIAHSFNVERPRKDRQQRGANINRVVGRLILEPRDCEPYYRGACFINNQS